MGGAQSSQTTSAAGSYVGDETRKPSVVRSTAFALDEATVDKLENSTYFDREELVALYWCFSLTTGAERVVTKERFQQSFPAFMSPLVVDALFYAIGAEQEGIDFTCFAKALSVTCRGTPEEKLRLAFRIIDLDHNDVVSAEETRTVADQFAAILRDLGQTESRFGSPSKQVDSIFKYTDSQEMNHLSSWMFQIKRRKELKLFEKEVTAEEDKRLAKHQEVVEKVQDEIHNETKDSSKWMLALQLVKLRAAHEIERARRLKQRALKRRKDAEKTMLSTSLTWDKFSKRAINDPNFYQCFGLYDYMHGVILAPIEQKLAPDIQGAIEGFLQVTIEKKFHIIAPAPRQRFCVCIGQFLGLYSKHWNRRDHPKLVISLQYASVITTSAEEPAFRLVAPGFNGTFVAANFAQRKAWVTTIRKQVPRVNPYASFAPTRVNVPAKTFVGGREYFSDLYDALCTAKRRIFIAGWFFIPTLYLIRADPLDPKHRLDNVLLAKAKEGVNVYILIWNETTIAHPLASGKAMRYMEGLHPRIRVLRHPGTFPLSWSHHQKSVVIDDEISYIGGIDLAWGRYDDEHYRLFDPQSKRWPGNDYSNLIITRAENGNIGPDPFIDRNSTPRMPWHDISSRVGGRAAWDASRNFIQRWNHARITASSVRHMCTHFLMPTDLPQSISFISSLPATSSEHGATCTVQVLRSIAPWSGGVAVPEDSIYKAMIDLIEHSQHYIYIENQYFISSNIPGPVPRNRVALALLDRLRKAISKKQKFRVIVLLPLFPAGNLTDLATRYVLKWVYTTVNRKGDSLLRLLEAEFPEVDINEYVSFYNLRTWGKLGDKLCTHQIYVHSKLMIVDDRYAIIGSANINDRSLVGDRDSELSVLLTDNEHVETVMGGEPFSARRAVVELRLRIWQRLLGLPPGAASYERLQDPISDDVYKNLWLARAANNSRIYRSVFEHIEDNTEKLEDWQPLAWADAEAANFDYPELHRDCNEKCQSLCHVQGFVVKLSMILSASRLHPHMWEKEYFLQVDTFI